MPQAIKIVSQSEEQSLAALSKQRAARSPARQFTFSNGEDSFNQRAAAVFLPRKVSAHLGANAVNGPRLLSALGGDDAQSVKLLTKV